jgi:aminoglycoside phosphotransferase (APT) family kinase protein
MFNGHKMPINDDLARRLIELQFPQWRDLAIKAVKQSGWDNRTFHLGDDMSIRLPSDEEYAPQILKEFHWLPILAQGLSFQITTPLVLGLPCEDYPWHWSINKWIEGEASSIDSIKDMNHFAAQLATFLNELHKVDATGGPLAGEHNFYRGGALSAYDQEMRAAILLIQNPQDKNLIEQLWSDAVSSSWQERPVWVHGDLAVGNVLVKQGALNAIIDFGQLAIGDPACDLAITWNLFTGASRDRFKTSLSLDRDTWIRALGWTLWKSLCWPIKGTDVKRIINDVLMDYQSNFR